MNNNNVGLFPTQYRVFSGSALKTIAIVAMIIDHCAAYLLEGDVTLMRSVGRIAFPIFAFLIVQGFIHTHDRKRYGISLLVLAVISEVPWNLMHTGELLFERQNVIFTLLFGYICLCAIEELGDRIGLQAVVIAGTLALSYFFKADYGWVGVLYIVMLYFTNDHKILQIVLGSTMLSSTWRAGLAFIPINMYNGKRGFIKGNAWKYAFYAVYPVHMLIIWILK